VQSELVGSILCERQGPESVVQRYPMVRLLLDSARSFIVSLSVLSVLSVSVKPGDAVGFAFAALRLFFYVVYQLLLVNT